MKKVNFGQLFKELEEITAWFEREEVDLEDGLKKFERGLELARLLKGHLKGAENKVREIKDKFDSETEDKVEEKDDADEETAAKLDF